MELSTSDPCVGYVHSPEQSQPTTFIHQRLDDEKDQIRLLEMLHPLDENGYDLKFLMHHRSLSDDPEYNAISYTWGDDTTQQTIWIDGKKFNVRVNCYAALRQVYQQWRCGNASNPYVWVDSVCIDQQYLDEKGHQVAMMGEIFAKAARTFSCIGQHYDDSEFLFESAPVSDRFQKQPCQCVNLCNCHHKFPWAMFIQRAHFFGQEDSIRLLNAYGRFSQRSYWTRVWIVQEVVRSKEVIILCGAYALPWPSLVQLCRLCDLGFEWELYPVQISSTLDLTAIIEAEDRDVELDSLFENFRGHSCSDPRDRLYGLLSLVDWPASMPRIYPDYAMSTLELSVLLAPYLTGPYIRIMLQAFHVTSNDKQIERLITEKKFRQRSNQYQNKSEQQFQQNHPTTWEADDFQTLRICTYLCRDRNDNLSCGRNKPPYQENKRDAVSAMDAEKSQNLYRNGKVVGLLCNAADAGDLLIETHSRPRVTLVLRQNRGNVFDVIGQAILLDASKGLHDMFGYSPSEMDGEMNKTFRAQFHFKIKTEDLIVLLIQDVIDWRNVLEVDRSVRDEGRRRARVLVSVTDFPREAATLVDSEEPTLKALCVGSDNDAYRDSESDFETSSGDSDSGM